MRSKDVLKDALRDFDGTLIVVSHDREFLDGLVDKVYEFGNCRVREHLGGIYEFLERKQIESLRELERKNIQTSVDNQSVAQNDTSVKSSKLTYEEQKEQSRTIRRMEKAVAEAESRIEKLESEIAATELRMTTPEGASDTALYTRHEQLKNALSDAMEEWTERTVELENAFPDR